MHFFCLGKKNRCQIKRTKKFPQKDAHSESKTPPKKTPMNPLIIHVAAPLGACPYIAASVKPKTVPLRTRPCAVKTNIVTSSEVGTPLSAVLSNLFGDNIEVICLDALREAYFVANAEDMDECSASGQKTSDSYPLRTLSYQLYLDEFIATRITKTIIFLGANTVKSARVWLNDANSPIDEGEMNDEDWIDTRATIKYYIDDDSETLFREYFRDFFHGSLQKMVEILSQHEEEFKTILFTKGESEMDPSANEKRVIDRMKNVDMNEHLKWILPTTLQSFKNKYDELYKKRGYTFVPRNSILAEINTHLRNNVIRTNIIQNDAKDNFRTCALL